MQNLTNISNYIGDYTPGVDYKKFDFVFNKVDSLYYYAKDDITWSDELINTFANRYSLDPSGPLYAGAQTYYLFDAHNDMSDYKIGQTINIGGSLYENDGNFKILNIESNYNPSAIKPGDYVLSEILNGEEGVSDWFLSDWFLLDQKDIYWPGRDFAAYVDSNIDLYNAYESSDKTLTKEAWGRQHYNTYGETENRAVPLNERGNWIYHTKIGWVYTSIKGNFTPSDKSLWMNIGGLDDMWFFAKKDWTDGNNAVLYYEDSGREEYSYEITSENKSFDSDTREIDVSDDGQFLIARDNSSIKRYAKNGDTWIEQASLDFNGEYRYLCCDGDCDTIAVLSYDDNYYTLNTQMLQEYKVHYDYNSGPRASIYLSVVLGLPWKTESGPLTNSQLENFESISNLKYAGDLKIYKYNSSANAWEESHSISQIVEQNLIANFSKNGNNLFVFEPHSHEYNHYKNGLLTWRRQCMRVLAFSGSVWEDELIMAGTNYGNFVDNKEYSYDEHGYSQSLTIHFKTFDNNTYGSDVNVLYFNSHFVADQFSEYSSSKQVYGSGSFCARMSGDGNRIFYIDHNTNKIKYITRSNSGNWFDNIGEVTMGGDVYEYEFPDFPLPINEINFKAKQTGWGSSSRMNLEVNFDGSTVVAYGAKKSSYENLWNDFTQQYERFEKVTEKTLVYVNNSWKEIDLNIRTENVYNTVVNDIQLSRSSTSRLRAATIMSREINPKRHYDLQYIIGGISDASIPLSDLNLTSERGGFNNACLSIFELNDNNEWIQIGEFDRESKSIDFAVDENIDHVYNLKFDTSVSGQNSLYKYTVGYFKYYTLDSEDGFIYVQPSSTSDDLFDFYEVDQQTWFTLKSDKKIIQAANQQAQPTININFQQNEAPALNVGQDFGTRVWLVGASNNDSITQLEDKSDNEITLTSANTNPGVDSPDWISDVFFFDADYGSSVTFTCQNKKYEYSDGYYIYQPDSINSLSAEITLLFKNRSSRETNAVLHFVESHLGQYDKDRPSPNLKYSQGIAGFRWGGESTFHPYDSTSMQSKTFYCLSYDHSLNFEDSNDLTVKLNNFNTSLLNKSEELFVKRANDYSDTRYYEQNDVVFVKENHQHYYYKKEESGFGASPISSKSSTWSRNGGYYQDINTDSWTRDFFWKPSLGLKISNNPRLKKLNLNGPYTQIYRDGINEKLLNIDLEFNNRDDQEAYAILHFLEHHYGCIPFAFNVPAPYEQDRNFVCQKWTHTYNFKNNHSIKATFEEYPFKLSAQKYDSLITEPILRESELSIPSSIIFEDSIEALRRSNLFKKRVFFKNVGDKPLKIKSMQIIESEFDIVGQDEDSSEAVMLLEKDNDIDYVLVLPPGSNLPFGLNNQTIRIYKQYSDGVAGGTSFSVVQEINGSYQRVSIDGSPNRFFQSNAGYIMNLNTGEISDTYAGFIDDLLFKNNRNKYLSGSYISLNAGKTGYIDIYYNGSLQELDFYDSLTDAQFIQVIQAQKSFNGKLEIVVENSNGTEQTLSSDIQINLQK